MKKTKIKYIIAAIIGCIALGVFFFITSPQIQKLQAGMEIWNLLQPVLEAEYQSMELDASIYVGEKETKFESKMYRVKDENVNYLILKQANFPIFIVDNMLLLENGKAFKISDTALVSQDDVEKDVPNEDKLFKQVVEALKTFEITTKTVGGQMHYSVVITGEMVEDIMKEVLPTEQETLASVERLQMVLVTKGEKIVRIELNSASSVDAKDIKLEVALSKFEILKKGDYPIPEAVKRGLKETNPEELLCISRDLFPLLKASQSFETLGDREGSVRVGIDFGLIQLDTTLGTEELRGGTDKIENSLKVQEIPSWLSVLFLEGEISISSESKIYTYMLELDAETMEKIAEMMVPNLRTYQFAFTKSEAKLVVQEDEISSISISIHGMVDMFIKDVPLTLEMEYMFE